MSRWCILCRRLSARGLRLQVSIRAVSAKTCSDSSQYRVVCLAHALSRLSLQKVDIQRVSVAVRRCDARIRSTIPIRDHLDGRRDEYCSFSLEGSKVSVDDGSESVSLDVLVEKKDFIAELWQWGRERSNFGKPCDMFRCRTSGAGLKEIGCSRRSGVFWSTEVCLRDLRCQMPLMELWKHDPGHS